MSVTAATVINAVRDLIPDPVYDASGNPLPATDGGLFRSSTLLRWLNDGVKALAGQVGWVLEDWTALPLWNFQPWYALDSKWAGISEAFANSYRLGLADEGMTIWPSAVIGKQPAWYDVHKTSDHLEVGIFPIPNTTDITTTLNGAIGASDTLISIASLSGFLPAGYVLIDQELIAYRNTNAVPQIGIVSRGQGGTTAAAHNNGAVVSHCSAWFKGVRVPNEIAAVTDIIELPAGFIYILQEYMLSKCAYAQNDAQVGMAHMKTFNAEAQRVKADPFWRTDAQGVQVRPYGMPPLGRLAWGNVVVP